MWNLIGKGILLGLGAATPIGPVNVEIARRTLTRGFRAGFVFGCGAVTVDVLFFVITGLGLTELNRHLTFYWPLQMAGGLFLGYMGVMLLTASFRAGRVKVDAPIDESGTTISSLRGGYLTGLLMTCLSPLTLVFWFSAGTATAGAGQRRADVPIMSLGVLAATLGWLVFFTSVLKLVRRWRRQWWMMAADALGGTILLGVAGFALWTTLSRFL